MSAAVIDLAAVRHISARTAPDLPRPSVWTALMRLRRATDAVLLAHRTDDEALQVATESDLWRAMDDIKAMKAGRPAP